MATVSTPPQVQKPPGIHFYLPEEHWRGAIPQSPLEYWEEHESKRGPKHFGRYSWTLKTYLYLKQFGIDCSLTPVIPEDGIVIAHRDFLTGFDRHALKNVLLVCIKADRDPLETADLHIIQNPCDPISQSVRWEQRTYFIHYWPQEKIIPRDAGRASSLRNVAYIGRSWNLDPALQSEGWETALRETGMAWKMPAPDHWNDYRKIDAVVAVRRFNHSGNYANKPASKLVNSWIAGVPAILGNESAYRAERLSELDYIEVNSLSETIETLKYLKTNGDLYNQMIYNGKQRAENFNAVNIVAEWEQFIQNFAIPWYFQKVKLAG
jgi:hypothetical protein